MTKDEFQRETNDFMTTSAGEAAARAVDYNHRGVDGDTIVAAKFGDHWCLMLKSAFDYTRELGID